MYFGRSALVAASLFSVGSASTLDNILNALKPSLTSERYQKEFKVDVLAKHAKKFQSFADRNNGTRVFGSPGYNASVDYVYDLVRKAGYDVEKQTFVHPYEESITTSLVVGGAPVNVSGMTYSPSTPKGGLTAPLVLVPDAEAAPSAGCTLADYAGLDVAGKIALVQRGSCTFAVKSANAKTQGALGAVIYNNIPGSLSGTLGDLNDTKYAPVGGITLESGQYLIEKLASGAVVSATLNLDFYREQRYSSNIIATSKAGNHDKIVFIGAHLDSVKAGQVSRSLFAAALRASTCSLPGINDDGSGSITVLELALKLSKYKLTNAVRFGWWTAEEFGLVGSTHYIDSLSTEEKQKIALYINLDMVASPNPIYGVLDSDNSAGQNTAESPLGSAAIESTLIEYFTANKLPTIPSNFNGRSDYASLIANGIPSGGLFTGAEGLKTEEQAKMFGGQAGVAYDANYHQAGDDINNLNYDFWINNVKASAHAIATFIGSTKRIDDLKNSTIAHKELAKTSNEAFSVVEGAECGGEAI